MWFASCTSGTGPSARPLNGYSHRAPPCRQGGAFLIRGPALAGYNQAMPKLVILDGNSLLYRGFFAMRALTTSDRLPTNAVYSFILMLLTILERERPDAIFAAFDPPVATFRHQELAT